MRFRDLRHSAVTILLKMGIPPHVVQEIAGHSDIRTTLQIYGNALPGQQGEAMQKWDKVLEERDTEKHTRIQQQWEHYNTDVQACLETLLNNYEEGAVQIALQAIAHL